MVRSRALSKERVFYCIYKIDSFRAIVCKTYLFTGSLSVFELFFITAQHMTETLTDTGEVIFTETEKNRK